MTDVRTLEDNDWLHHYDMTKDEAVVEIESVEGIAVYDRKKNAQRRKIAVKFKGTDKRLLLTAAVNKNMMIELLGTNADEWSGKKVCLYKSTATVGGKSTGCIRIKAAK